MYIKSFTLKRYCISHLWGFIVSQRLFYERLCTLFSPKKIRLMATLQRPQSIVNDVNTVIGMIIDDVFIVFMRRWWRRFIFIESSLLFLIIFSLKSFSGEKPFACELCSYRTKQQSTLTRHMRTVHAPKSENGVPNSGGVQTIFDESQLLMLAANQAAASNMLPL